MRIIFIGSGEFGLPTLAWLCENYQLVGVVTQPDKPAGRKRKLRATPIGQWAQEHNIDVYKTDNVNEPDFVQKITSLNADAAIIVAFGQKLSPQFVEALGELAVNIHASLLPKYRGAAPINQAVINGETETGVTMIEIAQKMDAGAIHGQLSLKINPQETAGELHDRLAMLGPELTEEVLSNLRNGALNSHAQDDSKATLAPKMSKTDGTVDFNNSAVNIRNKIHGLTPWPGCKVNWHSGVNGKTQTLALLRVEVDSATNSAAAPGRVLDNLSVATCDNPLRLLEVQLAGGKPLTFKDFLHGHEFAAGDKLEVIGN